MAGFIFIFQSKWLIKGDRYSSKETLSQHLLLHQWSDMKQSFNLKSDDALVEYLFSCSSITDEYVYKAELSEGNASHHNKLSEQCTPAALHRQAFLWHMLLHKQPSQLSDSHARIPVKQHPRLLWHPLLHCRSKRWCILEFCIISMHVVILYVLHHLITSLFLRHSLMILFTTTWMAYCRTVPLMLYQQIYA